MGLMDFFAHKEFELLQADVFVGLLTSFPSLAHKPRKDLFIGISPTLLISNLIGVARLLVKLSETVGCLFEAVL